ncbi:MAG: class I SAM-dependent methyltransferase [Clostridium perfringens]|nr:class I SAM-dependent methyltransferase [Clostridium perfringens]
MSEKIDFDFMKNAAFPKGEEGTEILSNMNESHDELTTWTFNHIEFGERILDIGCGGGAAIAKIGKLYPKSTIYGCDVSPVSIQCTCEKNKNLIDEGRLKVEECGVSKLNFPDESFDSIYSIESLYFWPNQQEDLKEVFRVLKVGGKFITGLEMVGGNMNEKSTAIAEHLNMRCPSPEELKTLLENAGFSNVNIDYNKEKAWMCASAIRE